MSPQRQGGASRVSAWLMAGALGCSSQGAGPEVKAPQARRSAIPDGESARPVVLYSSEHDRLHTRLLDRPSGALRWVSSVTLPERVHYAVASPSGAHLYVSASNGKAQHWLYAYAIDPASGALTQQGEPLVPPAGRIIHLSIDPSGRYLVLAHNQTSQLSMVQLEADGRLGAFIPPKGPTETGFFAHQALFDRTGSTVIACGLGAPATAETPEQAGSLTVFAHQAGVLTRTQSVLPGPGLGPRHVDYWGTFVYVASERGNRLLGYDFVDSHLAAAPRFDVPTLIAPDNVRPRQRVGAIHIHPKEPYLYLSNRAAETVGAVSAGVSVDVFAGGENNIALFQLEPQIPRRSSSGAPRLIAHYDSRGFEPRTFSIEPAGEFLFVGNQVARNVLGAAGELSTVPSNVAVFRIGAGGRLSYIGKHDFLRGEIFWLGAMALPAPEEQRHGSQTR